MRLYKEKTNGEARVIGYSKSNFENPDSDDTAIWGKIKIHLVAFKKHDAALHKGLKDRKIHMGLSSSYLRKGLCVSKDGEFSEKWGKWIKEGNGFGQNHWHYEKDFDKIVTKRVERARKVELAGRNNKNEKEDPIDLYCGDSDAPIAILDSESG